MPTVKPFSALRPHRDYAERIASLPYDVFDRKEAKKEVLDKPYSFLRITRAEVDLHDEISFNASCVYKQALKNLNNFIKAGLLITDQKETFYLYKQEWQGRVQTGLVSLVSIEEYAKGIIKKHEFTRPEKELDRTQHIITTKAQTGMVFLTYKNNIKIKELLFKAMATEAEYDFIAPNGVRNTIYQINDAQMIDEIVKAFKMLTNFYIADGHHRSEAALKASEVLKNKNFLAVLFPDDELRILDYNRVIKDLNGLNKDTFLKELSFKFFIEKINNIEKPKQKGDFLMYLNDDWYHLCFKKELKKSGNILEGLDVNILQNEVLKPILGIKDPRIDSRINFVGGIKGLNELKKLVDSKEYEVAFSLYPTAIEDLFSVADTGNVMPPKSTWFEPKLLDGLLVHLI